MATITQKLGFDATSAINELASLTQALGQANTALASFQTGSKGSAALAKTTGQVDKAKKAASGLTVSWKTMARVVQTQMVVRGLNAIVQGLKDAVTQARLLGLAIEEVRTIDSNNRSALSLTSDLLEMSDAIGKAPVDLAEGLYQTLSNQVVKAGEAMHFTSEAAKLATVTASQTGDAVNALSSVMNSYRLEASQTEHVAGTLFKTVELGRLRLSEIANVIGRVTPLTAELGIKWEEVAASIATMTRQGVRADTAITQLRAVVTRLIKPTAEMSAIFHKWGVVDGKQAIETFGGLSGVLKKLEKETGSSSEGMAELLRNVRAISGAMGIMNDEGQTMEDILQGITEGSKSATDAWSQFSESDAQKLTKEFQEFNNQITRLGVDGLPVVVTMVGLMNDGLKGTIFYIDGMLGFWNDAENAARDYAAAVKKGDEEALSLRDALAESGRGAYDIIGTASNLYYAEANKKENELAAVRDNAIKEATASLGNAVNSLTELYKSSLKQIEKFSEQAANKVKESMARIAGIQQDVDDQILAYKLSNEEDEYRKRDIINKAYNESITDRAKAFAAISADPASRKAAEESNKRVVSLARQALGLAKERGAGTREIAEYQDKVVKALGAQIGAEQAFADIQSSALVNSQAQEKVVKDITARMAEMAKRNKEIHADGVVSPQEQAELDAMVKTREELNKVAKEGTEILKAFGLDTNFDTLVDGLTEALNAAEKDWDAEVKRAKAAFEAGVFILKVVLDPTGVKAAAGAALGVQPIEGETVASNQRRIDAAAQSVLKERWELTSQIRVLEQNMEEPRKASLRTLGLISKTIGETAQESAKLYVAARLHAFQTQTKQLENQTKGLQVAQEELSTVISIRDGYAQVIENLAAGNAVQEGSIEALRSQAYIALQNKEITQDQLDTFNQLSVQLQEQAKLSREALAIRKQMPVKEEIAAATEVLDQSKANAEVKRTEAQVANDVAGTYKLIAEEIKVGREAAEGQAIATANMGTETLNTANQAKAVGDNTATSTGQINQATVATSAYAAEMERAAAGARALQAAQAGNGALTVQNPFVGQAQGGRFLANGGMPTRGQDRIPASLAKGEMVVNSKSSGRFFSELNAMNQGSQPVFREQGGSVTNVGDVNVSVNGGDNSQQTVREIGHALRRQIQRGNIKLR